MFKSPKLRIWEKSLNKMLGNPSKKMAQWLRTLIAFAEDLSSVPSIFNEIITKKFPKSSERNGQPDTRGIYNPKYP